MGQILTLHNVTFIESQDSLPQTLQPGHIINMDSAHNTESDKDKDDETKTNAGGAHEDNAKDSNNTGDRDMVADFSCWWQKNPYWTSSIYPHP